jgi:hypothetical protein
VWLSPVVLSGFFNLVPITSQETITNHPTFRDITLKINRILPAILFAALMAACSQSSPPSATPFKPIATLQDIMQSIIDPNVDFVWNAVSSVSTAEGTQEHRPETDEEWQQIRQHTLALAEAGNLLLIENRRCRTQFARHSKTHRKQPRRLSKTHKLTAKCYRIVIGSD